MKYKLIDKNQIEVKVLNAERINGGSGTINYLFTHHSKILIRFKNIPKEIKNNASRIILRLVGLDCQNIRFTLYRNYYSYDFDNLPTGGVFDKENIIDTTIVSRTHASGMYQFIDFDITKTVFRFGFDAEYTVEMEHTPSTTPKILDINSQLEGIPFLYGELFPKDAIGGQGYANQIPISKSSSIIMNEVMGNCVFSTQIYQTKTMKNPIQFQLLETNHHFISSYCPFGVNWHHNYEFYAEVSGNFGNSDYIFLLKTVSGKTHKFYPFFDNNEKVEPGQPIKVYYDYQQYYLKSNGTMLYLEDINETKIFFTLIPFENNINKLLKIDKIVTKHGEKFDFTYDPITNKFLKKISNGEDYISFYYDTLSTDLKNNLVSNIRCSNQYGKVVIDYTPGSNKKILTIRKITTNQVTIENLYFHYDSLGRIKEVKDYIEKQQTSILYDEYENKISSISQKYDGGTDNIVASYEYLSSCTKVLDGKTNKLAWKHYDEYGLPRFIIDADGRTVNYRFGTSQSDIAHSNKRKMVAATGIMDHRDNYYRNSRFSQSPITNNPLSGFCPISSSPAITYQFYEKGIINETCLRINSSGTEEIEHHIEVEKGLGVLMFQGYYKAIGTTHVIISAIGNTTQKIELKSTDGAWERFQIRGIVANSNNKVTIRMTFRESGGYYFDGFSLTLESGIPKFNLIENGFMSDVNESGFPNNWNYNLEYDKIGKIEVMGEHLEYTEHYKIGKSALRILGNRDLERGIYKALNISGKKGEEFVYCMWTKAFPCTEDTLSVTLTFQYKDYTEETITYYPYRLNPFEERVYFDPDYSDERRGLRDLITWDSWKPFTEGITVKKDFSNVHISVDYKGINDILITGLQLYQVPTGTTYHEEEIPQVLEKTAMRVLTKNSSGLPTVEKNSFGTTKTYQYHNNQITHEKTEQLDGYGNKKMTDIDYVSRKVKETIVTVDGMTNKTEQELYSDGMLRSFTDEFENKTYVAKGYDEFEILYPDQKMEVHCLNDYQNLTELGVFHALDYQKYGPLSIMSEQNKNGHLLQYAYDKEIPTKLKTVTGPDRNKYEFTYDRLRRLIEVQQQGETIFKRVYDGKNYKDFYYGSTHAYEEKFDKDGKLINTNYADQPELDVLYNENEQIQKIIQYCENKTKETRYQYDDYENMIRIEEDGFEKKYHYNENAALKKTVHDFKSNVFASDFISNPKHPNIFQYFSTLSDETQCDYIFSDLYQEGQYGMGVDVGTDPHVVNGTSQKVNIVTLNRESQYLKFHFDKVNQKRPASYHGKSFFTQTIFKEEFAKSKVVYAWMKFSSKPTTNILTLSSNNNPVVSFYIVGNTSVAGVIPNKPYKQYFCNIDVKKWNLYGIKVEKNEAGEKKVNLLVNDIVFESFTIEGEMPDNLSILGCSNHEQHLIYVGVGAGTRHSKELQTKIYQSGIEILRNAPQQITSNAIVSYNPYAYEDCEVFTLNGNLVSSKMRKPIVSTPYEMNTLFNSLQFFEYDELLKRNVYASYGSAKVKEGKSKSSLTYAISSYPMTVSCFFKSKLNHPEIRNIFTLGQMFKIGLRTNNSLFCEVHGNSVELSDYLVLGLDYWYHLAVSYDGKTFNIYLDGELLKAIPFSGAPIEYIMVGHHNGTMQLEGNIDMLAISQKALDYGGIQTLYRLGQPQLFRKEFDSLGRLQKKEITLENKTFTEEYQYETLGNAQEGKRFTNRVQSVKMLDGTKYQYFYDKSGNINGTYRTGGGQRYEEHIFFYDVHGRIENEWVDGDCPRDTYYEYDNNGNLVYIDGINGYSLSYSNNVNNRLEKITCYKIGTTIEYPIEYKSDIKTNPTLYKGMKLEWRGKSLVKVENGNTTCHYKYNYNGIRNYKKVGDMEIFIYLEGMKVIGEKKGNSEIFYRYDEMKNLIGFHYKTREYIYNRNLLGEILEVLDNNGQIVIRYSYDAWGNILKEEGNQELIKMNSFKYKGYYYDVETSLYYLNNRYYDPEVGRFLNADNVRYLDSSSINGLNLYAYCLNNPINYADPSGNFPILALIIAGVLLFTPIGGTALQIATSVLSYAGMAVTSIWDKDVRANMNAIGWNPFNTNESATLKSSKVSFYKGVPVFRTASGGRSGSFGAIFLTKGSGVDTLRHERGHNWQLMIMGIGTYGFTVGIPSPLKLGPWDNAGNYYGAPWETMADILGGVKGRTHSNEEIRNAWGYYVVSTLCFPLTALYWF